MADTVAEVTREERWALIEATVEKKLIEMRVDSGEGLELNQRFTRSVRAGIFTGADNRVCYAM